MSTVMRCSATKQLSHPRPSIQAGQGDPLAIGSRRCLLSASILGAGLALVYRAESAAESNAPAPPPVAATGISISMAPKGASDYMRRRDEAMDFQCKGGMFDCDGDRRDFAKKQWEDFQARGGKKKDGPRSY